jgi:hypothetical protein
MAQITMLLLFIFHALINLFEYIIDPTADVYIYQR